MTLRYKKPDLKNEDSILETAERDMKYLEDRTR